LVTAVVGVVCVRRRLNTRSVLLELWWIIGALVLVNVFAALYSGVSMVEWAKEALPLLAWPCFATATAAEVHDKRQLQKVYDLTTATTFVPVAWLALSLPAILAGMGPGTLFAVREATIWNEGVGHFGAIAALLSPGVSKRPLRYLFFSLGAIVLLLSGIRSLWLGCTLGLLCQVRRARDGIALIAAALALLFALTSFEGLEAYSDRIGTIGPDNPSLDARMSESRALLSQLFDEPLTIITGRGAGATFKFQSRSQWEGVRSEQSFAHDFYLQLLWSHGIVFALLFVVTLLVAIRTSWPRGRASGCEAQRRGITGAFVASAITATASSFYGAPRWYILFGVLTGLAVVLRRCERYRAPVSQLAGRAAPTVLYTRDHGLVNH
jgi:hypothetical protein